MFPRILLKNTTWLMTIDWLGIGRLEVSNYQMGRSAVAPAWLKSHFINTVHELSAQGVDVGPANPIINRVMETYAQFVLNPTGLTARAALSQTPKQMADAMLESSFPQAREERKDVASAVQLFATETQKCTEEMVENANYIMRELPRVTITEQSRETTTRICSSLIATKPSVISELSSWNDTSMQAEQFVERIDRILNLLSSDRYKLHELVMALHEQSDSDKRFILASMLVGESATNILQSFNRVSDAADSVKNILNASART